jgi:hypothetical protein
MRFFFVGKNAQRSLFLRLLHFFCVRSAGAKKNASAPRVQKKMRPLRGCEWVQKKTFKLVIRKTKKKNKT